MIPPFIKERTLVDEANTLYFDWQDKNPNHNPQRSLTSPTREANKGTFPCHKLTQPKVQKGARQSQPGRECQGNPLFCGLFHF